MSDIEPDTVRLAYGTHGQSPDEGLARSLSEMARHLQAELTIEALLDRIARTAVVEINGAQHAGISEIEGGTVFTRAATGDTVRELDREQYRLGDGPCLTALREQRTVRSDDLRTEQRWPAFAAAAVTRGMRAMLAVQLFVDGKNLGALNLYSEKASGFDDDAESTAMLLATHAALAMRGARVEANLQTALDSRDVIGQAKGILMERFKLDAAQSFDLLVVASQRTHRKLRDVAEELAETGQLPAGAPTHRPTRPHAG